MKHVSVSRVRLANPSLVRQKSCAKAKRNPSRCWYVCPPATEGTSLAIAGCMFNELSKRPWPKRSGSRCPVAQYDKHFWLMYAKDTSPQVVVRCARWRLSAVP